MHLVPSTPDNTLLVFTLGIALGAWELNRPGMVLPGAVGLTCVLLSLAALPHLPLEPVSSALALVALVALAAGFLRTLPQILLLVAAAVYATSLHFLFAPAANPPLHLAVSLPCGILVGFGLAELATIARRARRAKGLD